MPSLNAPSSSAGAMATDFSEPSTSVNHRRTKRTSRSSSARRTKSSCLPMGLSLARHDVTPPLLSRRTPAAIRWLTCPSCASPSPRSTPVWATWTATPSSSSRRAARPPPAARTSSCFPEMVLTGYPIEDLAMRASLHRRVARGGGRARCAARRPRAAATSSPWSVSSTAPRTSPTRVGMPKNAPHELRGRHARRRASSPGRPSTTCGTTASATRSATSCRGDTINIVQVGGIDVALAICEDLWRDGPSAAAKAAEAACSSSRTALRTRRPRTTPGSSCARDAPATAMCALAYVNLVGGQDELVFDGDSLVVDADGELVARAAQFEPELLVVDLDLPAATAPMPDPDTRFEGLRVERTVISAEPFAPYDAAGAHRRRALGRPRRALPGDRARAARLRRQERLHQRADGPVRRHRLHAGRRHRRRRARRRDTSSASPTRASGRASTRAPTPPSSPSAPACGSTRSRSRRSSTPTRRR